MSRFGKIAQVAGVLGILTGPLAASEYCATQETVAKEASRILDLSCTEQDENKVSVKCYSSMVSILSILKECGPTGEGYLKKFNAIYSGSEVSQINK